MSLANPTEARNNTEKIVRHAKPWLHVLARFGFVTKGLIYLIMGILAFRTALGLSSKTTDAGGALEIIQTEPFGKGLLVAVVAGLAGYVFWRFIQAFLDPEGRGLSIKGILSRLGYFSSGCAYAALAYTSIQLIEGAEEQKNVTQHWTAHFLHMPFGQWLVAIAGAIIVAAGAYGVIVGVKTRFCEHMELGRMGKTGAKWLTMMGTLGYAARGIVFIVAGLFLMKAGIQSDPNAAKGMDGAQIMLGHLSAGFLYLVAVGLIAFGCFMFVEAKYNRIVVR